MEELVRNLIRSVEPKQPNVAPRMFTFFTSSEKTETNIPYEKILEILITESDISKKKDEIESENSEYNHLKCYLSYLISKYSNGKSTERVSILFEGLDKLPTVSIHNKLAMLKSLLLLSESRVGTTNYKRPDPLPYSNGTQAFSLYSDDYFDNIPSKNQMLYSNTSQLDNIGSNLSLDSGYFSLTCLPNTSSDRKMSNEPQFHSVLSKYSDISQYKLSSAFSSVQKEANPVRFTVKRVKKEIRHRLISETPDLYRDYVIFIKNKDKLNAALQPIIHPLPTPHIELFNAAINTLQGIDSNVCLMDSRSSNFRVNDFIVSDKYSTTPLVSLFKRFAKIGSCYSKLEKVSSYLQTGAKGTIGIALGVALNEVLCLYLANIIHFGPPKIKPDDVTLLKMYSHFHPYFVMIEGLGKIFHCLSTTKDGKWEPYLIPLQSGLDLLLYIQDTTVGIVTNDPLHNTMCHLLTEASTPLLTYIQHWIFHGQIMDPTNEFGLQANEEKLDRRDEEFWTGGFTYSEVDFKFPCFLEGMEEMLLLCGKSLTLLRICDPTHYLIAKQPFKQLRMKLCLNTRIIREYQSYWKVYKDETINYLEGLRQKQEEELRQIELERTEVITRTNEERRRVAREKKEEQQKIATQQKQRLMSDLQVQIADKQKYKSEQDERKRELDAYYAAKSGTVLEAGVEDSGLVEEVKKEIKEKYAALEREALEKQRIAEQRKMELANKLGIIEAQPDSTLQAKEISDVSKEEIENTLLDVDPIENSPKLVSPQREVVSEVPKIEILDEKDAFDSPEKIESVESEIIENIEIEIKVEKPKLTPKEISSVDKPKPTKENFYLESQNRFKDCSLMEEDPIIELNDTQKQQYRDFLNEQESFTNYPIEELVKCSYFFPVHTQARIVNIYLLDYFRNQLQLDKHLTVLRKFVMMENGEFGDSLSMQIFNQLYTPDKPRYFFLLNMILEKALVAARVHNLPQVENLVLGYKEHDGVTTTNKKTTDKSPVTDELSNIVLEYNVGWPINVVLRNLTVKTFYSKIFNFLMQVKRGIWCMNSVNSALKSIQDRLVYQNQQALHQIKVLHLYRHEMQHFVTVLQSYLANQVLKVSWSTFQERLEKVENLEQLYIEHRNYVNNIMINMVLNQKGKPIYIAIKRIFFFILKFYQRIQESVWEPDECNLNNFAVLKEQYLQYKKISDYVFSLITKMVNNGYPSQLEYFILLIDFNSRFTKLSVSKYSSNY